MMMTIRFYNCFTSARLIGLLGKKNLVMAELAKSRIAGCALIVTLKVKYMGSFEQNKMSKNAVLI